MIRSLAALSCLLAGGCLLTTSLDGLAGAPLATSDDGGAIEASTGPLDDAMPDGDAATDTTSSDCDALFCANFDNVTTVGEGWTNTEIGDAGSIAFDTTTFVSAPRAFAAIVEANSDYEAAILTKYFPLAPPKSMHVDMDVYVDQIDFSFGGLSLGVFGVLGDRDLHDNGRINIGQGLVHLIEEYVVDGGDTDHENAFSYDWPLQRWVHVAVAISDTTLSLSLDGKVYATLGKLGAWDFSQTFFKIGLYYVAGQQQRVLFDNIVVDNK